MHQHWMNSSTIHINTKQSEIMELTKIRWAEKSRAIIAHHRFTAGLANRLTGITKYIYNKKKIMKLQNWIHVTNTNKKNAEDAKRN